MSGLLSAFQIFTWQAPYTRWVPMSGLLWAIQSFTTWQAPYCVKSSQVRITFSYTNLCDMTISITKIPKVGVQLLEQGSRLHARYLRLYTGVRNGYMCYLLIQQRKGEWRQQTKRVEESHVRITSGYNGYLLIQLRMGEWRQQTKCHAEEFNVRITFGYRNLHDITNPITKIPNTGVQWVRLHTHYVWQ